MRCDVNAHHGVWASTNTNISGKDLIEVLIEYNLEAFNVGSIPTGLTKNREGIIDLTLGGGL